MTPHQRAEQLVDAAARAGILTPDDALADPRRGRELYALAVVAFRDVLEEAAGVCTYVPDRLRIRDHLMNEPEDFELQHYPTPGPDHMGKLAFKPCGCAVDWHSDHDPALEPLERWRLRDAERLKLWAAQGLTWTYVLWSEAAVQLQVTNPGGCPHQHERRTVEREPLAAVDLDDLPGGAA